MPSSPALSTDSLALSRPNPSFCPDASQRIHLSTRVLRWGGWLALGLFLLLGGAESASAETPTARPLPPRRPDVREAPKPARRPKLIDVNINIRLRDKKSIRSRTIWFHSWRNANRTKTLKMKHGPVWLNLTLSIQKPGQLIVKGAFRAGGQYIPLKTRSRLLTEANPRWELTIVHATQKKDAGVRISLEAQLKESLKRQHNKRYSFRVKNVDLHRLFSRLAQFNNLRLSFDPAVKNVKGITLKLKASTRMGLVKTVCRRYKLRCGAMGEVLWVKPAKK